MDHDPLEYVDLIEEQQKQGHPWKHSDYVKLLGDPGIGDVDDNHDLHRAIESYVGSGSGLMNGPMRPDKRMYSLGHQGHTIPPPSLTPDTDQGYEHARKRIQAAAIRDYYSNYLRQGAELMKSFYPSPTDTVLYRGIHPESRTIAAHGYEEVPHPETAKRLKLHDDYGNLGYLSTSLNPSTAEMFADSKQGGMFKILVPEGAPIRPLFPYSQHGEHEVLLPPRSTFARIGDRDKRGMLPLMWTGRGKPDSGKYIGAALPFLASSYDDEDRP